MRPRPSGQTAQIAAALVLATVTAAILGPAPARATGLASRAGQAPSADGENLPRKPAAPAADAPSIQELAAELALARTAADRVRALRQKGNASQELVEETEGRCRVLEGRLAGLAEACREEAERLEARLEVRRAESDRAAVDLDAARAALDAQNSLARQVREAMGTGPLEKAKAKILRAEADLKVRAAEVREAEVWLRQARARQEAAARLGKPAAGGRPAPPPAGAGD